MSWPSGSNLPLAGSFLVETAETMNNLAHALYKRRIERGALELDIPEAEIRVDENGKVYK